MKRAKRPRYRVGDRVALVKDGPRMKAGWEGTVEWTGAFGRIVNVTMDHGGDSFFARREVRLVQRAD